MVLSAQRTQQLPGQIWPRLLGKKINFLGDARLDRRHLAQPSSVSDIQNRRVASRAAKPRGAPVTRAQYSIERVTEKEACEEVTGVVIMDQSGSLHHSPAQLHHFASLYRQVTKRENVEVAHAEASDGPTLEQAVRSCVQRGAERVVVVPYVTSNNHSGGSNLPFLLAEVQQRLPPRTRVVTTEAIGVDTLLVQLIENRVAAIEPTQVDVSERAWSDDAASMQSPRQKAAPKSVAAQREAARALPEQGAASGAGRLRFEYGNDLGGERGWGADVEAMQPVAAAAAAPRAAPSVWRDEPLPAQPAAAPPAAATAPRKPQAALAAEPGTGRLTLEREALRDDSRELAEAVRKMGDDVRALVADVQALKSLATKVNQQSSDMAILKEEVAALRTSVEGIERSRGTEQPSLGSATEAGEVEVLPGLGDDPAWQQGGWGGDGLSAERGWGPGQQGPAAPAASNGSSSNLGALGNDVIDVSPERGWGAAAQSSVPAAERGWGAAAQSSVPAAERGWGEQMQREVSPRPSRRRWRDMVDS